MVQVSRDLALKRMSQDPTFKTASVNSLLLGPVWTRISMSLITRICIFDRWIMNKSALRGNSVITKVNMDCTEVIWDRPILPKVVFNYRRLTKLWLMYLFQAYPTHQIYRCAQFHRLSHRYVSIVHRFIKTRANTCPNSMPDGSRIMPLSTWCLWPSDSDPDRLPFN